MKIFVKNKNLLTVYEYHIDELLKLVVKSLIKCTVSLVETKPLVLKNLPQEKQVSTEIELQGFIGTVTGNQAEPSSYGNQANKNKQTSS